MASRLRLSGFEQTSESSQGGRHANIPVDTTFPRQNHGRLKRIRPAGDSRLTARDCDSSRDEELVVAPADWAAAIRQLGPELDRATQAGVLPGRPGPEPADRLRPLRRHRQGCTGAPDCRQRRNSPGACGYPDMRARTQLNPYFFSNTPGL